MKATSTGGIAVQHPKWLLSLALVLLSFLSGTALADNAQVDDAQFRAFAQHDQAAYHQARDQYHAQPNNPVLAWQFGRTCYDWADWATTKSDRAAIAQEGIAACQHSLTITNSAGAHYYLALNAGQLAQAQMLRGLKLVREMAREFSTTADMNPHLDYAGAARGLGLLYRDTPGWPVSLGSRAKARKCLEDAAKLAPNDPENILNLAETDLKWNERTGAKKQLDALDDLWPKAKKNLTGPGWEHDWSDWSRRRDSLRQKLASN
jgi:hypothetical protein